MTYSTGSVILASDYNIFAQGGAASPDNNTANVNTVWGVGNGNKGYGQTTLPVLSTVAAGSDVVTATQWSTMLSRISSAASQQNSTITAITSPVAGNTISAFSALSTNITTIYNNRLNCNAAGTDITTGGSVSRATSWGTSVTFTHTITFASGDAARYFFNTGGRINLTYSRSGGSTNDQNTAITNLLTACGTVVITAGGAVTQTIAGSSYTGTTKVGGSGSPTVATTKGYYDLTTANLQVFTQSASSYYGYEGNSLTINIKSNGAQGANGDTGSVITIYSTVAKSGGLTTIDGTLSANLTLTPSATTYVTTTSWGTPTLAGSQTGS